ncbi:MAG: prepilin-type N-terminal cleavage/methylation domain-containing protein [Negativicutes bacterium]|nr:prepilin-type N-terminal cleavage/methylation domain-containing protein [Negativicutes bacterium]
MTIRCSGDVMVMHYLGKQQGFLLIEALVATVIIAVALIAVAGMFIQSQQAGVQAADYTAATALAQARLEALKAGLIVDDPEVIPVNSVEYTVTSPAPVSVHGGRLRQIGARVEWNERGRQMQVEMTTYVLN